jgi:hypothetical protein
MKRRDRAKTGEAKVRNGISKKEKSVSRLYAKLEMKKNSWARIKMKLAALMT